MWQLKFSVALHPQRPCKLPSTRYAFSAERGFNSCSRSTTQRGQGPIKICSGLVSDKLSNRQEDVHVNEDEKQTNNIVSMIRGQLCSTSDYQTSCLKRSSPTNRAHFKKKSNTTKSSNNYIHNVSVGIFPLLSKVRTATATNEKNA